MLIRNNKKIVLPGLIVQLYDRNESCQKCNFGQHWSPWSTFQDASFSPPESPNFSRFEKFKDLTNLTRYFRFDHKSVLVGMKVVRNGILNNLYLNDKHPSLHYSPSGILRSWPNSQIWYLSWGWAYAVEQCRIYCKNEGIFNFLKEKFTGRITTVGMRMVWWNLLTGAICLERRKSKLVTDRFNVTKTIYN